MTSHRPYREALSEEEALRHIEEGRGVLFDAKVVDACLALFRQGRFRFNRPPLDASSDGRI
jgi:HD-GYP domain-containing protein (c-di-GMP phosphodiesterase class II)